MPSQPLVQQLLSPSGCHCECVHSCRCVPKEHSQAIHTLSTRGLWWHQALLGVFDCFLGWDTVWVSCALPSFEPEQQHPPALRTLCVDEYIPSHCYTLINAGNHSFDCVSVSSEAATNCHLMRKMDLGIRLLWHPSDNTQTHTIVSQESIICV